MSAELGGSQISSLLEALPGIASVLRSPVADALVKAIRAAAGVGEFTMDDADELVRYAVRRGLIGPEEGDRVLGDIEGPLKSKPKPARAAAQRCDTAIVVTRAAAALEVDNVLAPLVVGACQEQAGRYDEAIATYNDFAAQYPNARGVAALRGKAQLALRAAAVRTAQQALAHEAELAVAPPQPATVAVLPLVIAGDSSVQPLSRGLAELITTDLAYVRTLRLLERLQIGTLLDELKLG